MKVRLQRFFAAALLLAAATAIADNGQALPPPDEPYQIRRAIVIDEPPPEPKPLWTNPLPPVAFRPLQDDPAEFLRQHPAKASLLPLAYLAVIAGDTEWLGGVIALGFPVDDRTFGGDTALCAAVRCGDLMAVRLLLLAGADPNLPGFNNQPPLALASLKRPVQIIEALLVAGAEPDCRFATPVDQRLLDGIVVRDLKNSLAEDRGITPLMACAARGDVEGAAALLRHGAKTSVRTSRYKRYPLGFAATQRFLFLMRVLLGRSPDEEPDVLITIDLSQQRAWLTKSGMVAESATISTGRRGYDTPAGRYVITDKHRWHVSNLYHVPMPWFMRLNSSAIGLHSGHVTGSPASHGCIRLPDAKARKFFQLAQVGDEVEIIQ